MSEVSPCTLFVASHRVALVGLPALFKRTGAATAFVSTPDKFYVARVEGDSLIVAEGKREEPLDPAILATAYECRAFGLKAELRWTRNGRAGNATVLSEDSAGEPHQCIDRLERKYFLWGSAAADRVERPDGWSAVSASRVGKVLVPCPSGDGRLKLQAFEYVKAGAHGNAFVLAERYVGFVRMFDQSRGDQT
jgi:CRISPR-associated protein (TIGR03984 family)